MIDENDFKQQEDFMFDSRNFYVKGATFNYCLSQQISVAISKMQGLTNSIRVSKRSLLLIRLCSTNYNRIYPFHFYDTIKTIPRKINQLNPIIYYMKSTPQFTANH